MMLAETVLSAFLIGLLGGVHCVAMCGGIAATLTFGLPPASQTRMSKLLPLQLAYNLGRIVSYGIAGLLMGGLGVLLSRMLPLYLAQKTLYGLAGTFMIALGLFLGGWWPGLARVEQIGVPLWRYLEPIGRRWLPIDRPSRAFILGLIWGWLPCGMVYGVLAWSATAGGVIPGAMIMLAFGLGTLPNLLALGLIAGGLTRQFRRPWVRRVAGGGVILFGLYALVRVTGWGAMMIH